MDHWLTQSSGRGHRGSSGSLRRIGEDFSRAGDPGIVLGPARVGRADVFAPRWVGRTGATRWRCWPACTTSGRPTRRVGECLEVVEESNLVADAVSPESANIREWRRGFDRVTKLPRSLVEELARTTSVAQQEWVEARKASDFDRFRPWLDSIIELKRQEAACLCHGRRCLRRTPRRIRAGGDGRGTRRRSSSRSAATSSLSSPRLPGRPEGRRRRPSKGIIPLDRQKIFGEMVASAIGFDFERGRLDTTAHPFCSGIGPGDTRITTRFDPRDFSERLLRHPPRGRPRALRARARPGPPRHADGRGGLARRPRVAIAALGERRWPEQGVLGALAAPGPAVLPRAAPRRRARRLPRGRSTGSNPP